MDSFGLVQQLPVGESVWADGDDVGEGGVSPTNGLDDFGRGGCLCGDRLCGVDVGPATLEPTPFGATLAQSDGGVSGRGDDPA